MWDTMQTHPNNLKTRRSYMNCICVDQMKKECKTLDFSRFFPQNKQKQNDDFLKNLVRNKLTAALGL